MPGICGTFSSIARTIGSVMATERRVAYTRVVVTRFRIERCLEVLPSGEHAEKRGSVDYWLNQPPEIRLAAVEFLRQQFHGPGARLRRVLRVTARTPR